MNAENMNNADFGANECDLSNCMVEVATTWPDPNYR